MKLLIVLACVCLAAADVSHLSQSEAYLPPQVNYQSAGSVESASLAPPTVTYNPGKTNVFGTPNLVGSRLVTGNIGANYAPSFSENAVIATSAPAYQSYAPNAYQFESASVAPLVISSPASAAYSQYSGIGVAPYVASSAYPYAQNSYEFGAINPISYAAPSPLSYSAGAYDFASVTPQPIIASSPAPIFNSGIEFSSLAPSYGFSTPAPYAAAPLVSSVAPFAVSSPASFAVTTAAPAVVAQKVVTQVPAYSGKYGKTGGYVYPKP